MDGPCLNSQIDLCYAPCSGEISKEEYDEIINKIDLFFQGKYSVIVKNLKKEMAEAAENEQFEKAAVLRDQITSIEEIMDKTGFSNRGTFYKAFAQKFEMTPKQYRNIKTKDVHDASEEGGGTMNV